MRIGYDIRPFLSRETGVGIYWRNLLRSLAAIDREDEFCLFSASWKERFFKDRLPPFTRRRFVDLPLPVQLLNSLWYKRNFPPLDLFFLRPLDLVHSPSPLPTPGGKRSILTVHDLTFWLRPELVQEDARAYFRNRFASALERADGVITPSETVRKQFRENFPNFDKRRVRTVNPGGDHLPPGEPWPLPVEGPFLLFVGTVELRKNIPLLLKAFQGIRSREPNLSLLLVGRAEKDLRTLFPQPGVTLFEEYISPARLKFIMEKAEMLVFPSLEEGFGLPVLEAASANLPVVASDIPAFRELFSPFPLLFPPSDPEPLVETVLSLLYDSSLREECRRLGKILSSRYPWSRCAEEVLSFYREIVP